MLLIPAVGLLAEGTAHAIGSLAHAQYHKQGQSISSAHRTSVLCLSQAWLRVSPLNPRF